MSETLSVGVGALRAEVADRRRTVKHLLDATEPKAADGRPSQADMLFALALTRYELICDENGKRLFTEDDVNDLLKKSFPAMKRVMELALKVNGLTEEEASELVGESESSQS